MNRSTALVPSLRIAGEQLGVLSGVGLAGVLFLAAGEHAEAVFDLLLRLSPRMVKAMPITKAATPTNTAMETMITET